MKKISKINLLRWGIALALCAVALFFYPRLPDQIPAHWGLNGEVRFDDKVVIFLMPALTLLFAVLFPIMRRIDPKSENYSKFSKFYDAFSVVMELFMAAMMAVMLIESFHPGTVNVKTLVLILLGLLFVFLGNSMPKVRHNYSMGVKTPWALHDERNWAKTQRLGGKCFFVCGLVALVCAFLPDYFAFGLFFAAVLITVLIPYVMSYVWFRQEKK
ncbi:MAG: SdpI family protein [Butyricicoccaceae bacterium]